MNALTPAVTLTENAAKRVAEIAAGEPATPWLRVSVDGGGCSGFQYKFDLVSEKAADDLVLEKAGAKPYVDFTIDPAMLAKFPGSYKGTAGNELTIVAAGARVTMGQAAAPPRQRLTLVATGEKAFKAIGAPLTVTFQV